MKKKNGRMAVILSILTAAGLFLCFAVRGFAYWGYLLFFIALLILAHRFLPPVLWKLVLALTCVGLAYFCVVEAVIIRNARTDPDPERDYLIVLGAAVYGEQPSLALQRRLEGALAYLERYPESRVIVSGGMGRGENITEAEAMRRWLLARGIPEERILMEERAGTTQENLIYSFEIIRELGDEPDGNVAIVSSDYHLFRAKTMAGRLGVQAVGVSSPWGNPLSMLNYFIREVFGVTHLWLLGS